MVQAKQLWIVRVKKEVIERDRKQPQPHVENYRPIKRYEILHRPFDLKFRGRINKWLESLDRKGIDFFELLETYQISLLSLYFYPKKNKWLNQDEVAKRIKGLSSWKVRTESVTSLLAIWEKEHT